MEQNICCFIGHRAVKETDELKLKLTGIIENLIVYKKIDTFLFGSKSNFNSLCLSIVTSLKEKHPHIKRIYVRAEYFYIDEQYKNYLLENFEETYFPEKIKNSGKAAYVERNYEMINKSYYCVVYYNSNSLTENSKSGTKIAVEYAIKHGKKIINVF